MTDLSEALVILSTDGTRQSPTELAKFIASSHDFVAVRDLAASLLDTSVKLARRCIEQRSQAIRYLNEMQQGYHEQLLAARSAVSSPPTVVIEKDAIQLTVPAPTFTFEAGALAVHADAHRTGATVEYDDKGRVVGVTPKAAP